MKKINFLEVYNFDSGTDETCRQASSGYLAEAEKALESSGFILNALIANSMNTVAPWRFKSIKNSSKNTT